MDSNLSVATPTLVLAATSKTQFSKFPMINISLKISFTQTNHFLWQMPPSIRTLALLLCITLSLIEPHLILLCMVVICPSSTTAHYNCTSVPEYPTYVVACASNDNLHSFAVFHEEAYQLENTCQSLVDVPVDMLIGDNLTSLF